MRRVATMASVATTTTVANMSQNMEHLRVGIVHTAGH